jgi:antitoxin (DNA-binding transcriptional repressor) of toxin-antitoxin stability system
MKRPKAKRADTQKGRTKGKRRLRSVYPTGPASTISATQAARTFSELLNRVRHRGETFLIERGGEPICEISPAKPPRRTGADLMVLLRKLPKPDGGFWDTVEEETQQEPMVLESPWER